MKVINFWRCAKCEIGEQITTTMDDASRSSEKHDKELHKSKWLSIFGWRIPPDGEKIKSEGEPG